MYFQSNERKRRSIDEVDIRKNWKGDASDKYIGKLESVYNDISNICTALENLGVGMSREASNIYQNQ